MPVSGMMRVTPPMMMNVCTPRITASPAASSLVKPRSDCTAMRNAVPTSRRNAMTTAIVHTSPSSSPMAANTKSFAALGILSGAPRPGPVPAMPPSANAYHDCTSW